MFRKIISLMRSIVLFLAWIGLLVNMFWGEESMSDGHFYIAVGILVIAGYLEEMLTLWENEKKTNDK